MPLAPQTRAIHLSGPEVDQIRRALLHIEHQQEDLKTGAQPPAVVVARLSEAVAGIRYLLERAEERRRLH